MRGPNRLVAVAAASAAFAGGEVPAIAENGGTEYQQQAANGGMPAYSRPTVTRTTLARQYTRELHDADGVLPPFLGGEDLVGHRHGDKSFYSFRIAHALVGIVTGKKAYFEVVSDRKTPDSVDNFRVKPVRGNRLSEVPNKKTWAPTSERTVRFPEIIRHGLLKVTRRHNLATTIESIDGTTKGEKFDAAIGKRSTYKKNVIIAGL